MALQQTKTAASKTQAPVTIHTTPGQFIFSRDNYMWLIISIAVVAFGFVLMSGTTDIYSTQKLLLLQ
jgi:hypothetical protein